MSTYLLIRDMLVPMDCESSSRRAGERVVWEHTAVSGATARHSAPKPRTRIHLGFDVSDPPQLRTLSALAGGEFGTTTVRVIDAWAQRTNVLDRRTSILDRWQADPMFSSSLRSTDDGQVFGRALVNVPLPYGASMTKGTNFYAPVPPAGEPVTLSAYVGSGDRGKIRPTWATSSGAAVAGSWSPMATLPTGGVLTRVSTTVAVPETVDVSGTAERVVGVGLIVAGATTSVIAAAPCVTWSDVLLPYMDGQCPLHMVMDTPSYDVLMAHGSPNGQAAAAQVSFAEVGG